MVRGRCRLWSRETNKSLSLLGLARCSPCGSAPETSPNSPSSPGCPSATARTAPHRCPRHGWLLRGGWGGETRAGWAEASGRGPEGNDLCPTARPGGWQKTLPLDGFPGKVFACLNAVKVFGLRLRHCNELTSRESCALRTGGNWRRWEGMRCSCQAPC